MKDNSLYAKGGRTIPLWLFAVIVAASGALLGFLSGFGVTH